MAYNNSNKTARHHSYSLHAELSPQLGEGSRRLGYQMGFLRPCDRSRCSSLSSPSHHRRRRWRLIPTLSPSVLELFFNKGRIRTAAHESSKILNHPVDPSAVEESETLVR